MPMNSPRSLLWSTFYPLCFCWESCRCVSQHLAHSKNLDETKMNSNLMLVVGHLSPLHSKTSLKMTKATIYRGSFWGQQRDHRRLLTLSHILPDGKSVDCSWQPLSGWMAFYSDSPVTLKNVHASIYSLNKSLYKSPVRWFFSGSNVPSNLLIRLFKVSVCSCLCDSSGTRAHFKMQGNWQKLFPSNLRKERKPRRYGFYKSALGKQNKTNWFSKIKLLLEQTEYVVVGMMYFVVCL